MVQYLDGCVEGLTKIEVPKTPYQEETSQEYTKLADSKTFGLAVEALANAMERCVHIRDAAGLDPSQLKDKFEAGETLLKSSRTTFVTSLLAKTLNSASFQAVAKFPSNNPSVTKMKGIIKVPVEAITKHKLEVNKDLHKQAADFLAK